MQRFRLAGLLLFFPALVCVTAFSGCGSTTTPKAATSPKGGNGGGGDLTELESKDWGELSGIVLYDGDPPAVKEVAMGDHTKTCHAGAEDWEKLEQFWMVDKKSKGVANVVIYLKPPEGKFFKISEADKKRTDTVVLKQPHCAFDPHVFVLYPSYYDKEKKKPVESGQKFSAINDSKNIEHNTKFNAGAGENNWTIPAGQAKPAANDPAVRFKTLEEPIYFKCNVHTFMQAIGWAFDHPYAATTNKEGKFTIPVPTGVEVHIHGWHEDGTVTFAGGKTGSTKMTFNKTNEPIEIKVKKK